ncbi:MAG: urease accessory UreF family protein [Caulobacteraceae bacterium]
MRMTIDPPVGPPIAAWSDEAMAGALFAWFSPAFPTGGFAYSHGIETAVAEGRIEGERGLAGWLEDILVHGAGWSDAVLLSLARRAGDADALLRIAELAAALAPSRERLAETLGQGRGLHPGRARRLARRHAPRPALSRRLSRGGGGPRAGASARL